MNSFHIVLHAINLVLLAAICLFFLFGSFSISPPIDNPIGDIFTYCSIVFMFGLWAVNYWFQYTRQKQKWILPVAGTVLYIAIVLFVVGIVFPFIGKLFIE
ncbi:hypothetical protein [Sporosarcina sp. NCCP-2222]|uniref:hypothetical protein n=1 Tax=Sporosarcina sp. NCCP-2222 TaxID=2935073 RepID=UPI0020C07977|nr:hypothetical protein [Sporosarcina sp. NCCP-2222]